MYFFISISTKFVDFFFLNRIDSIWWISFGITFRFEFSAWLRFSCFSLFYLSVIFTMRFFFLFTLHSCDLDSFLSLTWRSEVFSWLSAFSSLMISWLSLGWSLEAWKPGFSWVSSPWDRVEKLCWRMRFRVKKGLWLKAYLRGEERVNEWFGREWLVNSPKECRIC